MEHVDDIVEVKKSRKLKLINPKRSSGEKMAVSVAELKEDLRRDHSVLHESMQEKLLKMEEKGTPEMKTPTKAIGMRQVIGKLMNCLLKRFKSLSISSLILSIYYRQQFSCGLPRELSLEYYNNLTIVCGVDGI